MPNFDIISLLGAKGIPVQIAKAYGPFFLPSTIRRITVFKLLYFDCITLRALRLRPVYKQKTYFPPQKYTSLDFKYIL